MAAFLIPRLGLDLGTGKTVLVAGRKIAYNEPTVLVAESRTNHVLYTGRAASERAGKLGHGSELIRPVVRGAIADYAATRFLLRKIFTQAMKPPRALKPMVVASVPIRLNSVEERALCDAAREAGAGQIYLVPCNLASYVAISKNANDPRGSLIVDIGAGVTDISVLASNETIVGRTLESGGDDLTAIVQRVLELSYGVVTSREEAVQVKMRIGVIPKPGEKVIVNQARLHGESGTREVMIPQDSIAEFMLQSLKPLVDGVLETLEETPPELYQDIFYRGLFLSGGGSRLKGLAQALEERLQIKVNPVDEPELSVSRGISIILTDFGKFREFFRHHVTF